MRIAAGLLLWLVCLLPLQAQVILNDNFEKGDLNVQDLPLSSKWLTTDPRRLVFQPHALLFDTGRGSSDLIMTYFTDDEPVNLAVGESLNVQLTFVMNGIHKYPANGSDNSLRVGLMNSKGQRIRARRDLPRVDAYYTQYEGLVCFYEFQNRDATYFSFRERDFKAEEAISLIDVTKIYKKIGGGGQSQPLQDNTPYVLEFTIERREEKSLNITVGFSGKDLKDFKFSKVCKYEQAQAIQFDTFVFKVAEVSESGQGGSIAERITFTKFLVVKKGLFRGIGR